MENDETGCQPVDAPILCANNCGFFGSATTMDLCSRCYRELLSKQTKETEAAAAISAVHAQLQDKQNDEVEIRELTTTSSSLISATNEIKTALVASTSTTTSSDTKTVAVSDQPSLKPNRCGACNKRVGLSGFKCRCGGLFCASHRYNDKHECTFDYKAAGREVLTKANPVIKADKVTKI